MLAGDALKYTLELVRVDGVKSGFSIGNHEYVAAGPYEGIHYLYGFKLNPEMVSVNLVLEKNIWKLFF